METAVFRDAMLCSIVEVYHHISESHSSITSQKCSDVSMNPTV